MKQERVIILIDGSNFYFKLKDLGTIYKKVWLFLEFGDFGIAELFLPNLKWLLKQGHHQEIVI